MGPDKGKFQSPALGLIHELGHAHDYQYNYKQVAPLIQNGKLPEMGVISGVEKEFAEYYGEGGRNSHDGKFRKRRPVRMSVRFWLRYFKVKLFK